MHGADGGGASNGTNGADELHLQHKPKQTKKYDVIETNYRAHTHKPLDTGG